MRKRLTALLLIFCLIGPLLTAFSENAAEEGTSTRVNRALLIGCDRFRTQSNTVPSSANNVRRMAETLSGGTLVFDKLVTRENGMASADALLALIRQTFADANEGDVSYFYISTHGLWDGGSNGQMTFLISDGESESHLTAEALHTVFDTIAGKKVLLLDACHSGAVIGKGIVESFENVFSGEDYYVICSSGGAEVSWFWSGEINGERLAGAGYFSGALVDALSVSGSFGADENRDGNITLTELRRRLLQSHGESTVRTYPEESDFVLLSYDLSAVSGRRDTKIENVTFTGDTLSADSPTIDFSFNVIRSSQIAYQLVYQRQGVWDFDNATLIYDNNGEFDSYAIPGRSLTPGLKARSLTLNASAAQSSGYVLLQILLVDTGVPFVIYSKVLCVPSSSGDPMLAIRCADTFCPESGEEQTFVVRHAFPCELTVTIEDEGGQVVRRLASHQASRPEHIGGSTFCWSGRDSKGAMLPAGQYRIRVKAYVGDECYELTGEWFALTEAEK